MQQPHRLHSFWITRQSQKITGKVVLQCGLLRQWRKYLLTIQHNPLAVQCTCASGKSAFGCQKKRTLVVGLWVTHAPPTGHRHTSWICVPADENQTAPGLGNKEGMAGPQTSCVATSSWWHLLCLARDRRQTPLDSRHRRLLRIVGLRWFCNRSQ
jgi:hypothetical protein